MTCSQALRRNQLNSIELHTRLQKFRAVLLLTKEFDPVVDLLFHRSNF